MPFASMFQEDVTVTENFNHCTNLFAKEIFSRALEPVYKIFGMFQEVIGSFLENINQFLKYLAGMGNFTLSFADSVFSKLFNTFSVFTRQIGTLRDLFERITTSAYYAVFVVQTAVNFVVSLVKFGITLIQAMVIIMFALSFILALFFPIILAFVIPLGAMVGVSFCFHPNTKVKLHDGWEVTMDEIKIGDRIGDSIVTSVFVFECSPEVELYNYNGIVVSGRHLVYHGGKWKYVKDTGAVRDNGERPSRLICLNTSNNKIQIQNHIFRDYEEVDSEDFDTLDKIEKIVGISSSPAIHPKTMIALVNGSMEYIGDLYVGDTLLNGSKITCHVKHDMSGKDWYYYKGSIFGEDQPIMHEGVLKSAKDLGVKIDCPERSGFQIFTDSLDGLFEVGEEGIVVRDYPDSHDINILEDVQSIVLESLNR